MALWNKLKDELGRAGRAAQEAIDEGKLRLDLLRSRQAMDRAAGQIRLRRDQPKPGAVVAIQCADNV